MSKAKAATGGDLFFPHLPAKGAVRYGAPDLLGRADGKATANTAAGPSLRMTTYFL